MRDNHPRMRQQRGLERKKGNRPPYPRILIVCEGSETEPNYFNEIRRFKRLSSIYCKIVPSDFGTTPEKIVAYARFLVKKDNSWDEVYCVFRPGKQHSQKGTPQFLKKVLQQITELKPTEPLLFRLDSGNDSFETLAPLMKSGHFFLIKKNLRRESIEKWRDIAISMNNKEVSRQGKTVYTGVITGNHPKAEGFEDLPYIDQVYKVTIREIDKEGNRLLFEDVDVEVYWTNLYEVPQKVIALYHDHGTSEQFHSELKTDMNVERFPSGKMAVNTIILHLAMIAFNTMRIDGS